MQATEIEKKDEGSMEVKVAKAAFPPPNRNYSGGNPSLRDLHLHCFPVNAYKLLCELIERKQHLFFLFECREVRSTFFHSLELDLIKNCGGKKKKSAAF